MKLSPSGNFLREVAGGGPILSFFVYTRTVTDISTALSSGTWTDVTSRVETIPDITTRIEYEYGQFSTDSLQLELIDINWWATNVLTSSVLSDKTKYIEFKVEMKVSTASDVVPMFFGFVDKDAIKYHVPDDIILIDILTPQDIGFRISAENLTTQYLKYKVDGTNNGIILHSIYGAYPIKADIASYELKIGTHKIYYEYETGVGSKMKLDDGDYIVLSAGTNDLVNAKGDEKLRVYIPDLADLSINGADRLEDEVVIKTASSVLPYQWYENVGIRQLLKRYYAEIGINDVTFDSLVMRTYDNSPRVSFIDNPPEDVTVSGEKYAVAADNWGDIYVAVGNKVYLRDYDNETYTLKTTIDTGDVIRRIIYHWRSLSHEDLWIISLNGTAVKLTVYEIDNDRKYTVQTLTSTGGDSTVWYNSVAVVDYNYTGSSYKYALCFSKAHGGSDRGSFWSVVKGTYPSLTATEEFTNTHTPVGVGYGWLSNFMYVKSGNIIRTQAVYDGVGGGGYETVLINASGNFVQDSAVAVNVNFIFSKFCAYSSSDDRIYFYDSSAHKIKSIPEATWSTTDHTTFSSDPVEDFGSIATGGSKVYFTSKIWESSLIPYNDNYLHSVTGTNPSTIESQGPYTNYAQLSYSSAKSRLYGLSDNGLLFQHHTTLHFYVRRASFPGSTATDALNLALSSWNLVGTVTPAKKAYVYRRGDETGNAKTTGNNLAMDDSETVSYISDSYPYPAADLIKVSGFSYGDSYNGTLYGVSVLSDKRVLELSSELIPDELVPDILYYLYQFFKKSRPLVKLEIGMPLFHYEPFDNGQPYLLTKYAISGYGPIYAITYRANGTMIVEMLNDA